MTAAQDAPARLQNRTQPMLPLSQRSVPQILAIAPEKIERHKSWLATSKEQIAEPRFARIVQADDLAIQHSGPNLQFFANGFAQPAK